MAKSIISLENRVAIVTGGRRGLGESIAMTFAEAGADVSVWDVVTEDGKLESVAGKIKKLGRRSMAQGVDVTKKNQVNNAMDKVVKDFGKIDIIVNCAGIWMPGTPIVDVREADWDEVITTNLKGTFLCCQAAAARMLKQKKGNIINISSDLGILPFFGIGSYGAAKAGIILLTKQLAIELAPHVRVNSIGPGLIRTDMNAQLRATPEIDRKIATKWLLQRSGEPGDIANAALFLASDMSDWVTGQTLSITGGGQILPPLVD